MTELVDAPAHPAGLNYVGGAWVPSASGETYSKVNPMRPSETTGEYSASSAADAEAAVDRRRRCLRRLGRAADGAACRVSDRRRRRARAAHRGAGARHDARDGQAAARGARRGGSRRADPALRRERGVPLGGRALRAGGDGRAGLDPAAARRRRRADHALELPVRDPRLEARAGARSTATPSS